MILLLNPTNQLVPRFHRGHRKRAKRGWERRDKRPRAETEVHRGRQTLEASDGLIALAAATMPPSWRSMADLWSSYLPISIQRCTEAWQRLPRRFDEAPRACPKRGPTNPWKRRWNLRQRYIAIIPTFELDENGPFGITDRSWEKDKVMVIFFFLIFVSLKLFTYSSTWHRSKKLLLLLHVIIILYYYTRAKNVREICAFIANDHFYLNFWPWWKLKRQILPVDLERNNGHKFTKLTNANRFFTKQLLTALQKSLQIRTEVSRGFTMEARDIHHVRQVRDRVGHAVMTILQCQGDLRGQISHVG